MFFVFLITNLPCHVVTFQSALRVSQAVLKYKTDADIKETIRLYVLPMFNFTNYYYPSPLFQEVVTNSMFYFQQFDHYQKGLIPGALHSLLLDLTYPWWYIRLPLVHLIRGGPQGLTQYCHHIRGINLVVLFY